MGGDTCICIGLLPISFQKSIKKDLLALMVGNWVILKSFSLLNDKSYYLKFDIYGGDSETKELLFIWRKENVLYKAAILVLCHHEIHQLK